jgi:hypothetical protein
MTDVGSDRIVMFYSGGRDAGGRTLAEILAWSDERLERVHDYVQWVFPTRQPSGVNPFAPLVTEATVRAFAADPSLGDRLRASLDRMLAFYGLRRSGGRIEIDGPRFAARSVNWLHPGNHNHLRLTRIIDSLASLGLADDAAALRRCLVEDVAPRASGRITARTLEFWRRAGGDAA